MIILIKLNIEFVYPKMKINGKISNADTGEVLPYANIYLSDESGKPIGTGTTSNNDGNYILDEVSNDSLISVTYVGYPRQIFSVKDICNGAKCNIKINTSGINLNEFEVKAWSRKTKILITLGVVLGLIAAVFTINKLKNKS